MQTLYLNLDEVKRLYNLINIALESETPAVYGAVLIYIRDLLNEKPESENKKGLKDD